MPTFYCNYYFLLGTRGPLTLGGPLDFAYPAYPIVTPLDDRQTDHATEKCAALGGIACARQIPVDNYHDNVT